MRLVLHNVAARGKNVSLSARTSRCCCNSSGNKLERVCSSRTLWRAVGSPVSVYIGPVWLRVGTIGFCRKSSFQCSVPALSVRVLLWGGRKAEPSVPHLTEVRTLQFERLWKHLTHIDRIPFIIHQPSLQTSLSCSKVSFQILSYELSAFKLWNQDIF